MVSYSTTTAIVYGVSGSLFFFLIFLLIMLGLEPALRSLVSTSRDFIFYSNVKATNGMGNSEGIIAI